MNLNWLLVFIPIGFVLDWLGANPILVFLASALSIIPLAGLMGEATEVLAKYLGPTLGGLLNATLGNAPEIIISAFALHRGLVEVVKSSVAGSIIGNLLFGLGISFFLGGIKYGRPQRFNVDATKMATGMLLIICFGLIIPAVTQYSASASKSISEETAVVLFVAYIGYLISVMATHKEQIGKEGVKSTLKECGERPDEVEEHGPDWSRNMAIGILCMVTIGLAFMSEILTGAIEPAAKSLGIGELFAGVFLLALVGNAAELLNAVRFARKDQMDLSVAVTVGASAQVGLVVAPVLVFLGMFMGQDMNLIFTPLELIAIIMATFLTRSLTYDGESTWLEGMLLIAVYVLLGIGFFHHPGVEPPLPTTGAAAHATGSEN